MEISTGPTEGADWEGDSVIEDEPVVDYGSSSDEEYVAPELPPAAELVYSAKAMTAELEQKIAQDLEQYVDYYGRKPFKHVINLDILGDNGLAR